MEYTTSFKPETIKDLESVGWELCQYRDMKNMALCRVNTHGIMEYIVKLEQKPLHNDVFLLSPIKKDDNTTVDFYELTTELKIRESLWYCFWTNNQLNLQSILAPLLVKSNLKFTYNQDKRFGFIHDGKETILDNCTLDEALEWAIDYLS